MNTATPNEVPLILSWPVRVMATVRASATVTVEAFDLDQAIEEVKKIDVRDLVYETDGDTEIEGDEIAYIGAHRDAPADDFLNWDDVDVDMRQPGTSFSWQACQFVERIAKLNPDPDQHEARKLVAEAWAMVKGNEEMKEKGQADYEEDVKRKPFYHDGTPRKTWGQLCNVSKWSWSRPKKD